VTVLVWLAVAVAGALGLAALLVRRLPADPAGGDTWVVRAPEHASTRRRSLPPLSNCDPADEDDHEERARWIAGELHQAAARRAGA
jgi:hypothetical protein